MYVYIHIYIYIYTYIHTYIYLADSAVGRHERDERLQRREADERERDAHADDGHDPHPRVEAEDGREQQSEGDRGQQQLEDAQRPHPLPRNAGEVEGRDEQPHAGPLHELLGVALGAGVLGEDEVEVAQGVLGGDVGEGDLREADEARHGAEAAQRGAAADEVQRRDDVPRDLLAPAPEARGLRSTRRPLAAAAAAGAPLIIIIIIIMIMIIIIIITRIVQLIHNNDNPRRSCCRWLGPPRPASPTPAAT